MVHLAQIKKAPSLTFTMVTPATDQSDSDMSDLPGLFVSPPKDDTSPTAPDTPTPAARAPSPVLRAPSPVDMTVIPATSQVHVPRAPSPALRARSPSPAPSTTSSFGTPDLSRLKPDDASDSEVIVTEEPTRTPDSSWGLARNHSSLRLYLASRHNPFLSSLSSPGSPSPSRPPSQPSQPPSPTTPRPPRAKRTKVTEEGETLLRRMRAHQAQVVHLRAQKAELLAAYAAWMQVYEASPGKDAKLWKVLWDAFTALDGAPQVTRAQRRMEKAEKLERLERDKQKRWAPKILAGDEMLRTLLCVLLLWLVWRIGVESR